MVASILWRYGMPGQPPTAQPGSQSVVEIDDL
jgi:hypothetical protein